CKQASLMVLLRGIVDSVGQSQFDGLVRDTGQAEISGAAQHAGLIFNDYMNPPGDTHPSLAEWVPGDRGYILGNTKGDTNPLADGEWIVFTGNCPGCGEMFWGFGTGGEYPLRNTLDGWMQE